MLLGAYNKELLIKVLEEALEEAYTSEVLDTQMYECLIGPDNEYADKRDWIESKFNEWLTTVKEEKRVEITIFVDQMDGDVYYNESTATEAIRIALENGADEIKIKKGVANIAPEPPSKKLTTNKVSK